MFLEEQPIEGQIRLSLTSTDLLKNHLKIKFDWLLFHINTVLTCVIWRAANRTFPCLAKRPDSHDATVMRSVLSNQQLREGPPSESTSQYRRQYPPPHNCSPRSAMAHPHCTPIPMSPHPASRHRPSQVIQGDEGPRRHARIAWRLHRNQPPHEHSIVRDRQVNRGSARAHTRRRNDDRKDDF